MNQDIEYNDPKDHYEQEEENKFDEQKNLLPDEKSDIHQEPGKDNEEEVLPQELILNRQSISMSLQDSAIEIFWDKLVVTVTVKVPKMVDQKKVHIPEEKQIIRRIKGVLRPKQFTAILGPSGSGKTTLLNFLAGRQLSPNMKITGELRLNGQIVNSMSDYSNRIGYVTQDDILMSTMTPLESFMFCVTLRLSVPEEEKLRRVRIIIKDLGLEKCQNTRIGNAMMRGISGGERKRTSIGIELLSDPSVLMLDEPTTGLDSSTALQVIDLLKALAESGRTVVSTIHQPSSEIFNHFDKLLLVVKGNIIYQGDAKDSLEYFKILKFECPQYDNPSDFFMKLMNEEGFLMENKDTSIISKSLNFILVTDSNKISSKELFEQRLQMFVQTYRKSKQYSQIDSKETAKIEKSQNKYAASWGKQFSEVFARTFLDQIRNPVDSKLKLLQYIYYGVLIIVTFSHLGSGQARLQNISGLMMFSTILVTFPAIQGTLPVFSSQRALYLKERFGHYYSVGAYFWGKSLSELPFQCLYPAILVLVFYFVIGLSTTPWTNFLLLILNFLLTYWHAASYGLLVSVIIPKIEVAVTLIPTITVPFLAVGGFYTTQNTFPKIFYPFMYLSIFRYGYQGAVMIQLEGDPICGENDCEAETQLGIDYPSIFIPMVISFGLSICVRCLAWLLLYRISIPKKSELRQTLGESIYQDSFLQPNI